MVGGGIIRRLRPSRLTRRFASDARGVSAIEFAMIMPLMVALYLGGVELGDGMTIKRKVTRSTSTLSDLVTQARTIADADMKNILDASAAIIAPYPDGPLRIKVTGVEIDGKGVAKVAWSDARNDTAYNKGASIALPAGLLVKNSFLVTAELGYLYTPRIGHILTGSFDLKDQFFLRPRQSAVIKRVVK